MALMSAGYRDEAEAWRAWLQRSVAGSPHQLQIMYGLSGERQLLEWEVPWLPGYQGAQPVRVGNAAAGQLQLDVYRARGRYLSIAPARPCLRRIGVAAATEVHRAPGANLGAARRGNLGGQGRPPPLHLLEDHGVGGARSHGARRGTIQVVGAARAVAATARPNARDHLRARIRRQPQHLHAKLR